MGHEKANRAELALERNDPNLLEADQISQLVHAELTNDVSNDSGPTN